MPDYNVALNAVRLGWALSLIALVFNAYLFVTGDRFAVYGLMLAVLTLAGSYFFETFRAFDQGSLRSRYALQLAVIASAAGSHLVWFALAVER